MKDIPGTLKAIARWLVWKPIGPKKMPIGDDGRALNDWKNFPLSFEDAIARAAKFDKAQLGFLHGEGWGGIDLDACRTPDGAVDPRALAIVEQAGAYCEVSPSGEGLKIFGKSNGWMECNFRDPIDVIVFRKPDLYFAVTGKVYGDTHEVEVDLTKVIEFNVGLYGKGKDTPAKHGDFKLPDVIPRGMQNDYFFREACRHRQGGKTEDEIFGILMALRHRGDPPPSEKDMQAIAHSSKRYKQGEDDNFPLTETGDAEHFAFINSETVRFDYLKQRWLVFDTFRWKPQTAGELDRLALESVRTRQRNATGSKDRLRWSAGGESRSRRMNLIDLAKSVMPVSDSGDSWDENPWLLGVQNGVLDLRSAELREGRWEDRITMQTRAPYEPEKRSSLWEDTVADIFKDDPILIDFVQKAIGYSLTGDSREEVFFLCTGGGRNGKGTILNTVGEMLGDYRDNLSFHSLERGLHGPKESTNDLAKLHRRRLVTASENYGGRLDESRIKALTGRDPITARFLYKEEFTFIPDMKLWLSVNRPPKVRDDSEGFWSRVRLINFNQCYKGRENFKLKTDLLKPEHLVGVFTWAVEGCIKWQKEGLGVPPGIAVAVEKYRQAEDVLTEFYEERCAIAESARVKPSELYNDYVKWCDQMRIRHRSGSKAFYQQVGKRFRKITINGNALFSGIGLSIVDREKYEIGGEI